MGHGIELSIGELSEQEDVSGFVNMLHDFTLQVTKQDGGLYPPTSIQNMLRGLGRVIRHQQEKRILKTSISEVSFDIFKDIRYMKVFVTETEAVKRSFKAGLGVRVKTSDLLTLQEEVVVLQCARADISTPGGCNNTVHWYLCKNFFIRGQEEIRATNVAQFELLIEDGVETLRYKPILSKTFKYSVSNCASHSLRRLVDCSDSKVIRAWKNLMEHRPPLQILNEKFKNLPHPIFLLPKLKWKVSDPIWYQPRAMGKNPLGNMIRNLIEASGIDIKGRKFSNKTPRRMGISRMEAANIPCEKGMAITGHRDVKSYQQYNASSEKAAMAACQRIICGVSAVSDTGRPLKFNEVLAEEEVKEKSKVKADCSAAMKSLDKGKCFAPIQCDTTNLPVSNKFGVKETDSVGKGILIGSVSGCNVFNFSAGVDDVVMSAIFDRLQGVKKDFESPSGAVKEVEQ